MKGGRATTKDTKHRTRREARRRGVDSSERQTEKLRKQKKREGGVETALTPTHTQTQLGRASEGCAPQATNGRGRAGKKKVRGTTHVSYRERKSKDKSAGNLTALGEKVKRHRKRQRKVNDAPLRLQFNTKAGLQTLKIRRAPSRTKPSNSGTNNKKKVRTSRSTK